MAVEEFLLRRKLRSFRSEETGFLHQLLLLDEPVVKEWMHDLTFGGFEEIPVGDEQRELVFGGERELSLEGQGCHKSGATDQDYWKRSYQGFEEPEEKASPRS